MTLLKTILSVTPKATTANTITTSKQTVVREKAGPPQTLHHVKCHSLEGSWPPKDPSPTTPMTETAAQAHTYSIADFQGCQQLL